MKRWLEIAKSLPLTWNKHVVCPVCSSKGERPSASINNNIKTWSIYCYKCKYVEIQDKGVLSLEELRQQREALAKANEPLDLAMPSQASPVFSPEGRAWLQDCGISASVAAKYGICFNEESQGVILPCYARQQHSMQYKLQWLQERGVIEGAPKYRQPKAAKQGTWNNCLWQQSQVAVVTEDIASSVRIASATADNLNAHALMGTTINDSQTVLLMQYTTVILWLDSDTAGKDAVRSIRPILSKFVNVLIIETPLDPKKYSDREIVTMLANVLR